MASEMILAVYKNKAYVYMDLETARREHIMQEGIKLLYEKRQKTASYKGL